MIAAAVPTSTDPRRLDEALARVREAAPRWARTSLADRIALARSMLRGIGAIAERLVRAACEAKGIPPGAAAAGDEWLSTYITARTLRLHAEALQALSRRGNTPLGPLGETADGRVTAQVFPADLVDRLLFPAIRGEVHFQAGVGPRDVHERRASFHKRGAHGGRVALILGAGNVNAIPPADVATKLFNEGKVCVLKMNPVNAYAGPLLEEAFAEAVARGVLAVVYGGAEEGAYLAQHSAVDEVHITGSDKTHDAIVWGPPGAERAARMARDEPLLRKEITSELGNVSPVLVVPGPWDERTLRFQAESVAGMVTQNASFNCNAAKVLVTPRGWPGRPAFLEALERGLAIAPARRAWYPGAHERHRALTEGRPSVRRVGLDGEGTLPWTLVTGLDAASNDRAFTTEPFCAVLSETSVGTDDPVAFLEAAVDFANERLWGTLSAQLVVHPRTLRDPATRAAVARAVRRLRYGAVAVNTWAAYAFALGTTPWGAFPGATLRDIQSGRGFVHNTSMLEDVEKAVIWHPAVHPVKPSFFPSHRTVPAMGRGLVRREVTGSVVPLAGVVAAAVRA
jgi:aldehyde dehydrogenase (NAD(P)+)